MDGDEVGFAENIFQAARLDAHARDVFRRDERIETDHFHLQSGGALGDDAADVAQADDADGFVAQFHADEFIALPLAALERGGRLRDVARQRHHQGDGVFARGDVVAPRRVHHDDAFFGGGVGVDVFKAHAGAADDFQIFCGVDQFRGDFCAAANHPAVIFSANFLELVGLEADLDVDLEAAGVLKNRQTFRCQGIAD